MLIDTNIENDGCEIMVEPYCILKGLDIAMNNLNEALYGNDIISFSHTKYYDYDSLYTSIDFDICNKNSKTDMLTESEIQEQSSNKFIQTLYMDDEDFKLWMKLQ